MTHSDHDAARVWFRLIRRQSRASRTSAGAAVRKTWLAMALLAWVHPAAAARWPGQIPTPPRRPPEFGPPAHELPITPPTPPPRPSGLTDAPAPLAAPQPAAQPDASCEAALNGGKLIATSVPAVIGPGGCGIAAPLRLSGVILANGERVSVEPAALMRCSLGLALADWAREDIAPLVEKSGERLTKILDADSYDCRGRNRVLGAKLSEHGKGNAFDLTGLATASGKRFTVEKQRESAATMLELKRSACARFTTVLGPGSDGYHESHAHVDLAERRGGYRLCQWNAP